MKIKTWNALASALLCILAAMFVSGCEKKNAGGVAAPGLEDTKAIAEQGFIYGLPIVMNYAVMNEYAVDKNNSQYKAPFNQITNEHRVLTYEDTAVVTPNSDTPYSMVWLDLHAEPIVISVPGTKDINGWGTDADLVGNWRGSQQSVSRTDCQHGQSLYDVPCDCCGARGRNGDRTAVQTG